MSDHESVLAVFVIADEGPSPDPKLGRRWSLSLVVRGKPWPVGRWVNGTTIDEAAQKFARSLAPYEGP
jgi:hypothetical protein